MSNDALIVTADLINDKVKFRTASNLRPEQEMIFDYVPPLGDGEGVLGLEGLLLSFAGCVSTALVALLRRMGHDPKGFRMTAEAIRRESPVMLEKIIARFTVAAAIPGEDAAKVIEMASRMSPVWLAIKGNVEVSMEYGG